jgi:hypothetical protein
VAYHAGVILLANGDRRGGRKLLGIALRGEVELTTGEVAHARALLGGDVVARPARLECGAPRDALPRTD